MEFPLGQGSNHFANEHHYLFNIAFFFLTHIVLFLIMQLDYGSDNTSQNQSSQGRFTI